MEGNWNHLRGNVGPVGVTSAAEARQRRAESLAEKKRELGFVMNIRNATVFDGGKNAVTVGCCLVSFFSAFFFFLKERKNWFCELCEVEVCLGLGSASLDWGI